MSMEDPYGGTPKYSTASSIYEALCAMSSGEEIGILGEMFEDVSWDGQDYYYTDNAGKLVDRWDALTDGGEKQWLMDVAVFQLSDGDANDFIFEALYNDAMAKRIGFKKLFVDIALCGDGAKYKEVAEAFEEELRELSRFGFCENAEALYDAMNGAVEYGVVRSRYSDLCSAIYKKLKGLRLDGEKQLVIESRALLTAYDDFMFGLKSNQYLYNQQETMYRVKVAQLQATYNDAVKWLLATAAAQGVALELPEIKLLEETGNI